jgi:hypothetical protein
VEQDSNGAIKQSLIERDERIRRVGCKPGESARDRIPKRVHELLAAYTLEFGNAMTPAVRADLMLACHLIYKAERTNDCEQAAKASNAARHILESLRRRVNVRVKHTPSPPSDLYDSPLRRRFQQKVAAE